MPRMEMLLYHGLDATGTIQISTTSDTGPWTDLTLTTTQRVTDALAEWESLANAALPARTWTFTVYEDEGYGWVSFEASGGSAWCKLTPCLADLFGFPAQTFDATDAVENNGYAPKVLAISTYAVSPDFQTVAVGLSFPADVEEGELVEYRGGRSSAIHYGRAMEVTVDVIIPRAELPSADFFWDLAEGSPLYSGHAAFYVEQDESTAFGDGQLDGSLVCYPIETATIEHDSPDDPVWIRMRCTTEDP